MNNKSDAWNSTACSIELSGLKLADALKDSIRAATTLSPEAPSAVPLQIEASLPLMFGMSEESRKPLSSYRLLLDGFGV